MSRSRAEITGFRRTRSMSHYSELGWSSWSSAPRGGLTRCVRAVRRWHSGEWMGLEETKQLSGHGVGLLDHE
jgi:hypothetical protein